MINKSSKSAKVKNDDLGQTATDEESVELMAERLAVLLWECCQYQRRMREEKGVQKETSQERHKS